MDSGRIEDFLKQYITHLQNAQGEPRTGREQQEQNDTNQHSFATTNSAIPYGFRRSGLSDQLCGSPKPRRNLP
jgi:hypothetical protein